MIELIPQALRAAALVASSTILFGLLPSAALEAWLNGTEPRRGVVVRILALSPLLAGLIGGLATLIGLLVPLDAWLTASAASLAAAVFLFRHRLHLRNRSSAKGASAQDLTLLMSMFAVTLALPGAIRYPVAPDAQDLWFLKSRWILAGASTFQEALAQPFWLTGYPPLAPAYGALAWRFGDSNNDLVPQLATAALTVGLAIALAGLLTQRMIEAEAVTVVDSTSRTDDRRRIYTLGALGALFAWWALGIGRGNGFDGYVDLPAALATTGVAVGFGIGPSRRAQASLLLFSLAAALIKNESLLILFVLGLVHLLATRARPPVPWFVGIGIGAGWHGLVRLHGSSGETWLVARALPWSQDWFTRLSEIGSHAVANWPLRISAILAVSAMLLDHLCPDGSDSAGVRKLAGRFMALALLVLAVLCSVYLATPYDLSWHLRTSIWRVLLTVDVLLLCSFICSIDALITRLPSTTNRILASGASANRG